MIETNIEIPEHIKNMTDEEKSVIDYYSDQMELHYDLWLFFKLQEKLEKSGLIE